jgi:hypothetical protein
MTIAIERGLRGLSDAELANEIERAEKALDRLDSAFWPDAHRQRVGVLDRLTELRAEVARRRT